MKHLIVNADDYGLTSGVNCAIIEAHTRGILTSATLMANMSAFEEAVRLAKEHLSLGVGLHFNITQGFPIANASSIGSLLNQQGAFCGTSTVLFRRWVTGKLRVREIEMELRAQIEKVLQTGLKLTHVDSHKHSHALPPVYEAIANTIGDYGIQAVRWPRESWRFNGLNGPAKLLTQNIAAFGLAQLCRTSESKLRRSRIKTSDAFFGVTQTGFWTKRWLLDLIHILPTGVSELMSHPGYADGELGQVQTRLRESRQVELSLLTDPDVISTVIEAGVRLMNFSQLQ